MRGFWQKFGEHILAPAEFSGSQLVGLLTPAGRSAELQRHAAMVILARVRLIAMLFAILVPLCAVIDLMVFDFATASRLIVLRLASTAVFLTLAWPRDLSVSHPYAQAVGALLVLLLVPPVFHLLSANHLGRANGGEIQQLVSQLYAYLPTIVLGGLAIFPLTALETLLLALPVIAIGLAGALLSAEVLTLTQHGGTLWFMLMMLGVAIFSGMSQCHYMATLVIKATQDPLTGAYTRRSGEEALNLLYRLNQMAGKSLTIAFADLDRFKSINDSYGHEAGDQCLRDFVTNLRSGLRRSDLLIRWGGEEFIAALPDTPLENVAMLLERLRRAGLGQRPDGQPISASIGIANSLEEHAGGWQTLVQRADQRMYAAKQGGRDSVVWPDGHRQVLTPEAQQATAAETTPMAATTSSPG